MAFQIQINLFLQSVIGGGSDNGDSGRGVDCGGVGGVGDGCELIQV